MNMSGQPRTSHSISSNLNITGSSADILSATASSEMPVIDLQRGAQVWGFEGMLPLDELRSPFVLQDLRRAEEMDMGEIFTFNTIQFSTQNFGKPLVITAMFFMRTQMGLVQKLGLHEEKLVTFLEAVERGYSRVNPYHNNIHAADVTQRFATVITRSELESAVLGDLEVLAGMIAAILHDFHHPGTTNNYQVQTKSPVAKQFNDQHVLENQSLVLGLELLEPGRNTNFLEGRLTKEEEGSLRSNVIALVLGTDMLEHFNILSNFKAKVMSKNKGCAASPSPGVKRTQEFTSEERVLILKMALKCADIGHVTLPPDVHLVWVQSLQAEFYKQGDLERKNKAPISFLCDKKKPRNGPAYGENQLGFIDVICEPMYGAWVKMFPTCEELLNNLQLNRRYWEDESKSNREAVAHTNNVCEV
eukprot:CAMPEP_0196579542 /NCGR_PEP_ID=MMETSP1081-20130531/22557_1 /TAXON_ID=36882 /ORGANISM="Pyramimonas amylifera, Strain CCMP720" /LENGTH=417 /DNA_ID=CAMNT_0041899165 /DNA_START=21 /DNA_END=1274 /DNA_ORIENTATION=-